MDQITETGLADVVSDLVTSRGSRVAVLQYNRNERTGMKLLLRFASSEREFFRKIVVF